MLFCLLSYLVVSCLTVSFLIVPCFIVLYLPYIKKCSLSYDRETMVLSNCCLIVVYCLTYQILLFHTIFILYLIVPYHLISYYLIFTLFYALPCMVGLPYLVP